MFTYLNVVNLSYHFSKMPKVFMFIILNYFFELIEQSKGRRCLVVLEQFTVASNLDVHRATGLLFNAFFKVFKDFKAFSAKRFLTLVRVGQRSIAFE